ncbi:hypothetical protein QBC42DRAFT_269358 [Cladorrhinum samala]|uniref:Uncharacterized protein n=1 Tax=Cladorrhinum samala TaxID=585594 RepID=A0AAV9HLU7_9PEZI|nr:hypothetical protein QBC42DRAFT_269358 [Cladorrhinum samala]
MLAAPDTVVCSPSQRQSPFAILLTWNNRAFTLSMEATPTNPPSIPTIACAPAVLGFEGLPFCQITLPAVCHHPAKTTPQVVIYDQHVEVTDTQVFAHFVVSLMRSQQVVLSFHVEDSVLESLGFTRPSGGRLFNKNVKVQGMNGPTLINAVKKEDLTVVLEWYNPSCVEINFGWVAMLTTQGDQKYWPRGVVESAEGEFCIKRGRDLTIMRQKMRGDYSERVGWSHSVMRRFIVKVSIESQPENAEEQAKETTLVEQHQKKEAKKKLERKAKSRFHFPKFRSKKSEA